MKKLTHDQKERLNVLIASALSTLSEGQITTKRLLIEKGQPYDPVGVHAAERAVQIFIKG